MLLCDDFCGILFTQGGDDVLELYENIKKLRKQNKWSQDDLAKKAGYTDRSSIAKIEKGQIDLPQSKIILFADIFGVDPGVLMGMDGVRSETGKTYDNIHPISTRRFPVLSSIACGEPILMQDERELYVDASAQIRADFVLVAKGDSMTGARIHDGDLVFIRSQPNVENGEIAAVGIGDEATLKRVFWYANKTLLVLRAENPKYADMEYSGEALNNVHIFGKAVAFQSDVV